MKKTLAILMLAAVILTSACGNGGTSAPQSSGQTPLSSNGTPTEPSQSTQGAASVPSGAGSGDVQPDGSGAPTEPTQNTQGAASVPSGTGGASAKAAESAQGAASVPAPAESEEVQPEGSGSNILVAYFSRVGNTVWEDGVDAVTSATLNVVDGEFAGNAQLLAGMAQQATGGDLFLIQTVDTYPSDYRATTDQATVEQRENARPALASHVENMDQYDTIVLIYPNWWGTLPQALFTFLEEYDFSGKTILPLCTHEGSRLGNSESAIASLCPDAKLSEGLDVRGSNARTAQSEVESWLSAAGLVD